MADDNVVRPNFGAGGQPQPETTESKVVQLEGLETTLDLPASTVLAGALKTEFSELMVLGWSSDNELYVASTTSDLKSALWLLRHAERRILDLAGED